MHFSLILSVSPSFSGPFQELSYGLFDKGVAIIMVDMGAQRLSPVVGLLNSCILYHLDLIQQ